MPFGLHDGEVVLLQIGGGGRILVGDGVRQWWEKPQKRSRSWRVAPDIDRGQIYPTREEAEQVVTNLATPT